MTKQYPTFVDKNDHGFILIAVLWISLLLSIFALNTATKSRLQGLQAMNIQERPVMMQDLYSALDQGYHEYRKYQANKALLDNKGEWEASTGKELELWYPRYEPYRLDYGGQKYGVRIMSTRGRLDINRVDQQLLEEIVVVCGASPGAQATSIVNSILDWIDEDDLKRTGGAEKDYYLSLTDPYLPKNNEIENIQELLLVRGVTRDIFYGTSEHPGLVDFLSVRGGSEMLDINSASPETFALLGDMPPETLDDINIQIMNEPLTRIAELGELIPHGYFDQFQKHYTVEAVKEVEIQAFRILDDGSKGHSVSRIYRAGE